MIRAINIILLVCCTHILISQCIDELWHNTSSNSIWLSCTQRPNPLTEIGNSHWILYEFDQVESIENLRVWNINHPDLINSGAKSIRIDVSSDGASWSNMGNLDLGIGNSLRTNTGEEYPDMAPFNAKFILFTILQNHGGGACSGFGEVLFKLGEATTRTEDEYLSSLVTISPNPADQYFNVLLDGISTSRFYYQLVDMTGRVMLTDEVDTYGTKNEITIDGSSLSDGQYSLRINTDAGQVSKKVIVIHPR